jgi:hypothetical protein
MVESGVEVEVDPTRDYTSQRKDRFHSVQAVAAPIFGPMCCAVILISSQMQWPDSL